LAAPEELVRWIDAAGVGGVDLGIAHLKGEAIMTAWDIVLWIVFGLVAGILAKWIFR